MPSARAYIFTINNPSSQLEPSLWQGLKAVVWQEEVGESGNHHFQGYLEWNSQISKVRLHRMPGLERAFFDIRRGTKEQAIAYCSDIAKETYIDGPWYWPSREAFRAGQGQRNDLLAVQREIMDGRDMDYIADNHFPEWVKYRASFAMYASMVNPPIEKAEYALASFNYAPITDFSKSILVCGPSGCGKTQWVLAHFQSPLFVTHIDQLREFRPRRHDAIIFDDMTFRHIPPQARIHLLDQANTRRIHCRYEAAIIPPHTKKIFTSNHDNIFQGENDTQADRDAIERRYRTIRFHGNLFGVVQQSPQPAPSLRQFNYAQARRYADLLLCADDYLIPMQ